MRLLVKDMRNRSVGLFIVSAYSPIGNADETEWDEFMEQLDQCTARKHKDDILVIGTDANSSLGTMKRRDQPSLTSVGSFGNPHINAAGRRYRTYLEMKNMVALTTYFQKKSYSTWIHPRSKLPHQIDHFITEKSSFSRFADAGLTEPVLDSDHLAIMCKVRIAVRLKKRSNPRQQLLRLDASILKDEERRAEFSAKVAENFAAGEENEEAYPKLSAAVVSAAK